MAVDKQAAIGDAFGPRHSSDIAIRKQTPYRPTTHTRPQKFYTSAIGLLLFLFDVFCFWYIVFCYETKSPEPYQSLSLGFLHTNSSFLQLCVYV
jgi:hypothetical protein